MGPKYEFTGETMNFNGHLLHRIRRLSDDKLGGWIEKEENLSQEGSCWVGNNAKVYENAKVYGNAKVYSNANGGYCVEIYGNAKVYDNAIVHWESKIYGNAKIYGDAQVDGNVEVYGNAQIYGNAVIWDNTKVYGNTKIIDGKYTTGEFSCDGDLPKNNETKKVIQDFIYKVDDSNKLTTQTEYDSIDEFFSEPITNDIKLDTLIICTVDTKEPLIKLQKVEVEDKIKFKFIVEITNEDGDDFIVRSTIKSQDQLNQLIQQTIEALKQFTQFSKYADDLEKYL